MVEKIKLSLQLILYRDTRSIISRENYILLNLESEIKPGCTRNWQYEIISFNQFYHRFPLSTMKSPSNQKTCSETKRRQINSDVMYHAWHRAPHQQPSNARCRIQKNDLPHFDMDYCVLRTLVRTRLKCRDLEHSFELPIEPYRFTSKKVRKEAA